VIVHSLATAVRLGKCDQRLLEVRSIGLVAARLGAERRERDSLVALAADDDVGAKQLDERLVDLARARMASISVSKQANNASDQLQRILQADGTARTFCSRPRNDAASRFTFEEISP